MANQRDVAVKDDAVVTGEIIANHIDLTHNAQVISSSDCEQLMLGCGWAASRLRTPRDHTPRR
jgi:hypothetical protein